MSIEDDVPMDEQDIDAEHEMDEEQEEEIPENERKVICYEIVFYFTTLGLYSWC